MFLSDLVLASYLKGRILDTFMIIKMLNYFKQIQATVFIKKIINPVQYREALLYHSHLCKSYGFVSEFALSRSLF